MSILLKIKLIKIYKFYFILCKENININWKKEYKSKLYKYMVIIYIITVHTYKSVRDTNYIIYYSYIN